MTPRTIQAVLRSLADTGPPVPDADLLRRHVANDGAAFAELVRRHGRLVWAVCRHLTRSDAEADDAFQATFLVLLKNAGKVRDAGKLSAWLHGVAYKVCAKTRLAARRRQAREQARAVRDGAGSAVPDSAWDRALAAVHEEVATLPETQRVAFVLCCLEGIGVTEAAAQLGWKLGTLSGRLTRAKGAVLAKLEARGLTMGVVASVGLVGVPAAVAAKASALAQVGCAIPGSVLQLSQGVIGMSLKSVKMLAAAVMVSCGLGLGVGTGWVTHAEAQTGPGVRLEDAEAKRLQAQLEEARAAEQNAAQALRLHEKVTKVFAIISAFSTAKWEYDHIEMAATFHQANFVAYLREREANGWEFLGSMKRGNNAGESQWLFRRPVKGAPPTLLGETAQPNRNVGGLKLSARPEMPTVAPADEAKAIEIEAEIARLSGKLSELKGKATRMVIFKGAAPEPAEFVKLLSKMADKKFGAGSVTIRPVEGGIAVEGGDDAIAWVTGVMKALAVN